MGCVGRKKDSEGSHLELVGLDRHRDALRHRLVDCEQLCGRELGSLRPESQSITEHRRVDKAISETTEHQLQELTEL